MTYQTYDDRVSEGRFERSSLNVKEECACFILETCEVSAGMESEFLGCHNFRVRLVI